MKKGYKVIRREFVTGQMVSAIAQRTVEYPVGEEVTPEYGALFVFHSFEAAYEFARTTMIIRSEIWECDYEPSEYDVPERVPSSTNRWEHQRFWEDIESWLKYRKWSRGTSTPPGTRFASKVVLTKLVTEYTGYGE